MNLDSLIKELDSIDRFKRYGKVTRVVGLTVESKGPTASVGDVCLIHIGKTKRTIQAEVVGFLDEKVLLMPFHSVQDISPGSFVETTGKPLEIKVGSELIGKILDADGNAFDGFPLPKGLATHSVENQPPNPLERPRIREPIGIGVRSIDSLLSVGKGQRVGIFAGSGVGKSTLLGMIARNTNADLNVIALVGERGREVREFIERDLGEEGLKRSIVVVATSDRPALMRIKGAMVATAIAEYFRDRGQDVLLMMDSVTRVAMAQREIGLAVGEPPTTKGYTPSVFALLPRLLERSGTNRNGSITAFYTVLVDGDDFDEPIADAVRGILDGHFVLNRKLAHKGQYPAVDILQSVSRVMNDIVSEGHRMAAERFRELLSTYKESEDLIHIGAYKKGNSSEVDEAIARYPAIQSFLKQTVDEQVSRKDAVNALMNQFGRGEPR
ncbi:MAG TPA: flagellar protein export ATPase FliI [Bacillales bacterium]|nr:flagellar protein export ATPase FliI [Bacillales bacterium]